MTALGIEMTDRDPPVGWEAIKPSRRIPPQLSEAEENLLAAWAAVDKAIDNEFPADLQAELCRQAKEAEEKYREAWLAEDQRRAALLKGTQP